MMYTNWANRPAGDQIPAVGAAQKNAEETRELLTAWALLSYPNRGSLPGGASGEKATGQVFGSIQYFHIQFRRTGA